MADISDITLVTGSADKLAEWQSIFVDPPLRSEDIDLEEIQGEGDLKRIVEHKVRSAYDQLKKPVIVEDVALHVDTLGGMPGPFIKYFLKSMGKSALWDMIGHAESPARAICTAAYFDGTTLLTAPGVAHGTIVEPRGERGFGFDFTFQPEGHDRTYAEMSLDEKNQISHRHLAIVALFDQLRS